ncbi:hypothetical protein RvY_05344 [Ramazzottius varieornatus]|uniref:Nondiscriminating glutamyl-tRNA synthetase EARS2, mitochondrial n=1 Tax=Ramazzottius varieornatus TaxID=947166 RepID=A0A1D1UYD1_RAMVA|nr:hypothetical protein RvY_05344 [Ramazzottius varieornatus]
MHTLRLQCTRPCRMIVQRTASVWEADAFPDCSRRCFSTQDAAPRLRFAPSPTGFLHLGGLRTALYNYLFCKQTGGTFVLRIEDTDQARVVPGAVENMFESLSWLGIDPDEDVRRGGRFGPYVQSERLKLYQEQVEVLLETQTAYRCFCSPLRLELMRKEAIKSSQVPRYDNRCRKLSFEEAEKRHEAGEPSVIRLKLDSRLYQYTDAVYGPVSCGTDQEGDLVLLKGDGFPTYHLANVVDDHFMEITHVLRGVEWQISTPKHLRLYEAFGWTPPVFAHLPLLMNTDGSKLSKRHGALDILQYREKGIYPEALINMLVQAGGGFRNLNVAQTNKLFRMEELIEKFDLSLVNKNSCQIAFDKLPDFNKEVLRSKMKTPSELAGLVREVQTLVSSKYGKQLDPLVAENILTWSKGRISTLQDLLAPDMEFVWIRPANDVLSISKLGGDVVQLVIDSFLDIPTSDFNSSNVPKLLREMAEENNLKFKELMHTLRLALCGTTQGPSIGEVVEILGKDECLYRLQNITAEKQNKARSP